MFSPQQPQNNADTWIRPRSQKSFALFLVLTLNFFVFAYAANEAKAEEILPEEILPVAQRCPAPPDAPPNTAICPPNVKPLAIDTPTPLTPPTDNPSVGTGAHGMPSAGPLLPPMDSTPPPGPEREPKESSLRSPDANVVDLQPEPMLPYQGQAPEEDSSGPSRPHGPTTLPIYQPGPKDSSEEALPLPRLNADPGPPAMEVPVALGSTKEPKPGAPYLPSKGSPAGAQPSSSPGVMSASDKAASDKEVSDKAASPGITTKPSAKPVPSVTHHNTHQIPSRAQGSGAAQPKEVPQVAVPVVQQAPLPSFAAESHLAVHDTLAQTIKAASETLTGDLVGLVESWTPDWLPFSEQLQSPLEVVTALDLLDPLFPTMPPVDESSFFSVAGGGQVGAGGGGMGVLLLGVLATVLILVRKDGSLSWISGESPKPTSALLMPLERPG